jgi:hypothetical protein
MEKLTEPGLVSFVASPLQAGS